jgi:hypothetical protein
MLFTLHANLNFFNFCLASFRMLLSRSYKKSHISKALKIKEMKWIAFCPIISAKIYLIKRIFYDSSYKSAKYFCYKYFFIHLHRQTANVAGDLIPCFAIIYFGNG